MLPLGFAALLGIVLGRFFKVAVLGDICGADRTVKRSRRVLDDSGSGSGGVLSAARLPSRIDDRTPDRPSATLPAGARQAGDFRRFLTHALRVNRRRPAAGRRMSAP